MAKRKIRLALAQIHSEPGNKTVNWERGAALIRQAAQEKADLICFPELFFGGYFLPSEQMQKVAEPKDGPFVQQLCQLSKECGIHVIAGYAEATEITGRIYNSAVFVSDKGSVIGNMRKVYAWGDEKKIFRNGDKFPVFDTSIGRIGLMICYDAEFPEPARIMALKGAELVLVPSVWSIGAKHRWEIDLSGNALFNLMFVAGVNTIQDGCCGCSQVVGPDGVVRAIAEEAKEELLFCDIDLDEIQQVRSRIPYMNDFKEDTFSMDAVTKY